MPMLPEKQPYEEYYVEVKISDLGSEDISTHTITVTDENDSDVTALILDTAKTTIDGNCLNLWIRGGDSAKYYLFLIRVVGTSGSRFEKETSMRVFDKSM